MLINREVAADLALEDVENATGALREAELHVQAAFRGVTAAKRYQRRAAMRIESLIQTSGQITAA